MPRSAIYGIDDNDFASRVASDALTPSPGNAGTNLSDFWGKTVDDAAKSKGNTDSREENTVKIMRKQAASGGDKEAMDASTKGGQRHRKGPGSF